jgi:hypothetical protein
MLLQETPALTGQWIFVHKKRFMEMDREGLLMVDRFQIGVMFKLGTGRFAKKLLFFLELALYLQFPIADEVCVGGEVLVELSQFFAL